MTKQIRELKSFTRKNPNPVVLIDAEGNRRKYLYEFTMYDTFVEWKAGPIRYRGAKHTADVKVPAFGLIICKVWYDEEGKRFEESFDLGGIGAERYQVNALYQELGRTVVPNHDMRIKSDSNTLLPDEFVAQIVAKDMALWKKNAWGNPFGKQADKLLKEKLEAQDAPPPPVDAAKQQDDNESPLAKLKAVFSNQQLLYREA